MNMVTANVIQVFALASLAGFHIFAWWCGGKERTGLRVLFYSFAATIIWMLFFALILPSWVSETDGEAVVGQVFLGVFNLIALLQTGIFWPLFILIKNADAKSVNKLKILPWYLGFLALAAAVALAIILFIGIALSHMGDGAGPYGPTRNQIFLIYSPVLGLLLIAISCLPFMHGLRLLFFGIFIYLILGGVMIQAVVGRIWWLVFPALFFLISWQALYQQRQKLSSNSGSRNLKPDPEKLITAPEEIRKLDEQTRVK